MLKWKKGSLTLNAQHRPQRNQNNNNRGNSRVGMKTEGLVHNGRPAKWKKAEKQERDEKWRGKNRAVTPGVDDGEHRRMWKSGKGGIIIINMNNYY